MTWPTAGLPLPEDRANSTDSTDNHPLDHSTIAGVINSFISTLGKVDLTGFVNTPTFYDPASTNYNDRGWFAPWWSKFGAPGIINPTWGVGDGSSYISLLVEADTDGHDADLDGFAYANGSKTARWRFTAHVDDDDSDAQASVELNANGIGLLFIADGTTSKMQVQGYAAQTDSALSIIDSSSNEIFGIAPDGSVSGVAPSVGDSIKWDGTKWAAQA